MTLNPIAATLRRPLGTVTTLGSLLLGTAVLVACGGGGGVGGSGTGSVQVTGFSAGTVTGKGSTIVNGVRFDDSSAGVSDDDNPSKSGLKGDDVLVGMEVEIEHGVITCPSASVADKSSAAALAECAASGTTPEAVATKISYGGKSIVGPVSNFVAGDATATPATPSTFTLLGQKVQFFGKPEGLLTTLSNGDIVEVQGVYDTVTTITTASRVELKPGAVSFRLRGVLTVDVGGTTGTVGSALVDLSGVAAEAAALKGQVVRVKVDASVPSPFKVQSIKSTQRKLDDRKGLDVEVEGVIDSDVVDTAGVLTFSINGAQISVPAGVTTLTLAKGNRVEVEGHVDATSGVLVAKKVKAEDASGNDDTAAGGTGGTGGTGGAGGAVGVGLQLEFHGRLVRPIATGETGCKDGAGATTAFINTYNQANRTFAIWTTTVPYTLRETIQITADTSFVGNKGRSFSETALSNLCTGGLVVVFGRRSADGTTIIASKVKNDTSTE